MSEQLLLTFNAGSSSVKIGIFEAGDDKPKRIGKAVVDFASQPLKLHLTEGPQQYDVPLGSDAGDDLSELMNEVFEELVRHFDLHSVTAAGHRIVHGGDIFEGPANLDEEAIGKIEGLTELAPLHQPQALRIIHAVRNLRPELAQTGSFDTTFHTTQDELARRLAIPRALHEQGIRRYGFHGLSYAYIAEAMRNRAPDLADGKLVIAHLGSGASLCAIEGGKSRDCSMGFSALDGIPMATRPGWLDPGVILHLLGPLGRSLKDVEDMLYHKSGLLGVSGISGDTRALIDDGSEPARQAIDLFAFRIAGEICRLTATLGGLDAIVFTAGIGEHQPKIRDMVCQRLAWLDVALDPAANDRGDERITAVTSRIAVFVVPTDEEQMIAEECLSLTRPNRR